MKKKEIKKRKACDACKYLSDLKNILLTADKPKNKNLNTNKEVEKTLNTLNANFQYFKDSKLIDFYVRNNV